MNTLDFILIAIFLIGAFSGYRKGFLMEIFSLLALILGVLGGFKLMGTAMVALSQYYNVDDKILPYIAFLLVFVIIVILVSLLGKMLSSSLEKTIFGSADKLMGACLGALKTVFMISVMIWIVTELEISLPTNWTEESALYPFASTFAPTITGWVSELIPAFGDLFS